ncbi:MAG: hypothetical protein R2749_15660 [Acidimicrobiales bacterium]
MGIDEFVDLDIEEFQRRANERLLNLIERNRPTIEADLGATFDAVEQQGRIELRVADPELPAGRPRLRRHHDGGGPAAAHRRVRPLRRAPLTRRRSRSLGSLASPAVTTEQLRLTAFSHGAG